MLIGESDGFNVYVIKKNEDRLFYKGKKIDEQQLMEIVHRFRKGLISLKVPFFEYVAWDFVVKDNGYALIETNMKSSLNVFQIHRGMRDEKIGEKYLERGFLEN